MTCHHSGSVSFSLVPECLSMACRCLVINKCLLIEFLLMSGNGFIVSIDGLGLLAILDKKLRLLPKGGGEFPMSWKHSNPVCRRLCNCFKLGEGISCHGDSKKKELFFNSVPNIRALK